MKAPLLLVFAALTLGLTGCFKKEELPECVGSCTVVTGRLLTSGSAPLLGATVTLRWADGPSYNPQSRNKGIATTDENGRYRVSGFLSDEELANGFIAVAFSPDKSKHYLIGEPQLAFYRLKRDTVYTAADYLIPRKAFIKFFTTNPSQIPDPYSYNVDLSSCYGSNTVFSNNIRGGGVSVAAFGLSTTSVFEVAGDQPILVRQRKNYAYVPRNDTLFIPAGTTKTYALTY